MVEEHQRRLGRPAQALANLTTEVQLVFEPQRHRQAKAAQPSGGVSQVRLQQTLEFREGLIIESDVIELVWFQTAFLKAVSDRLEGKTGVVLLAREALLLCGPDNVAIHNQRRGAVVVKGRDPQDRGHTLAPLQLPAELG